ncbi:Tetraspanin-14 [Camelus dromedarius]|uniref:Tetraspanin-14 n=1 Tax=Camelus dromedarius TaxID=9838 RepID=A0A5N4DKI7_CAMDR|nr:Tetraspanin-14 [Camelus dromedarius]KAB1271713.1 Tetraspanin-14 [Camelus dromedarius]KAB1271714.1 Tetraspanin-14 [Camelus dromedarius]
MELVSDLNLFLFSPCPHSVGWSCLPRSRTLGMERKASLVQGWLLEIQAGLVGILSPVSRVLSAVPKSPRGLAAVVSRADLGLPSGMDPGVLSDLTKVTRMHGIDPVVLVLMVGVVMFTLGFAGCVGALRENICLLNFFCSAIVLIFFLELAVAVLAFLFQDWVRDRFREFFESNIRSYRDDIDLQNLIDSLQKANQCCGAYGPEDWDLNVYFNCSGASYSREKCGVPFSCCVPDPAQKVVNTQCGYDVRTQLKSKWDESIFTKGCIQALEGWLPRNIYIVAGVFIAISLLQIFGIFLARTLISDIEAVKAGHHF